MNIPIQLQRFDSLEDERLTLMAGAGHMVREAERLLSKAGLNVVGECLRGQGVFYEMEHYPQGDVYDQETLSQYYYHHHRQSSEHGHFHTFMRAGSQTSEATDQPPTHLVGISMDDFGAPISLFATNRWVTNETFRQAEQATNLADRFAVEHAHPNWAVNRWITAMMTLFYPQVRALLEHRDKVIAAQAEAFPLVDVFEDRALEVTGELAVSVEDQIARITDVTKSKP